MYQMVEEIQYLNKEAKTRPNKELIISKALVHLLFQQTLSSKIPQKKKCL